MNETATGTNPALPNYVRPEYVYYLPDLTMIDDLLEGTRRMRNKASIYIRKWTDEDAAVYRIRSEGEEVFEGLGRTLSAGVGMLFAKPPTMEWNMEDKRLENQWENIDAAGTSGPVFVKRFSEASLRDGLGLILVDHPSPPIDPETGEPMQVTAAIEEEYNLRPQWTFYDRAHILSWRTEKINNQEQVTQLVLWEPTAQPDGVFGIKIVDRYRVLRMAQGAASWTLFERVGDKKTIESFSVIGSGFFRNISGEARTKLPIAVAYTGRKKAPMVSSIPLVGVAWANLGHWQQSTDLRFYLSLSAFPQPTVIGELAKIQSATGEMKPGKLKIGPMVVIHLSGEGSDFRYTVVPKDGYEPLQNAVKEKKDRMGELGMTFLTSDTRQAETAEAKRLDATAENATLATAAQGIDDAINEAHIIHAWYLGIDESSAGTFSLNRDFESTAMDAQTMVAYVTAVKDANFPPRLLLEAWQAGGRIPPETDLDELEMEIEAAIAAKAEEERMAREERIAKLTSQGEQPLEEGIAAD
jgi:hypothetical protein